MLRNTAPLCRLVANNFPSSFLLSVPHPNENFKGVKVVALLVGLGSNKSRSLLARSWEIIINTLNIIYVRNIRICN